MRVYKITGGAALGAPQDLKHSDLYFSHSIIVSFFFSSHSVFLNSHSALFECLVSLHSTSFREQSMSLPGQSIFGQLRQASPQPVGNNAIRANVTITVKACKREVETIALPQGRMADVPPNLPHWFARVERKKIGGCGSNRRGGAAPDDEIRRYQDGRPTRLAGANHASDPR